MKIKNIFVILLMLLPFLIIFNYNVEAETSYYTGFEDGTINQGYTHTWDGLRLDTTFDAGRFEVESEGQVGSKAFMVDTENLDMFWNLTYGVGTGNIGEFMCAMSCNGLPDNWFVFEVWNKTLYENGGTYPFLYFFENAGSLRCLNHNANTITLGTMQTYYKSFGFTISANDSIIYDYGGKTYNTPRNTSYNLNFHKLDMFKFWDGASEENAIHWDEVYFNLTSGYDDTNGTSYCISPSITSSHSIDDDKFIETKFIPVTEIGITGNLTRIELPISVNQYINSNDINYYDVVVNGENLGHPTYISDYDSDNCPYALVWTGFTKSLDDNFPIFSFGSYKKFGRYWNGYAVSDTTADLHHKTHNSDTSHNNSVYDGTQINFDMYFCFYLTDYEFEPPVNTTPNTTLSTFYFKFFDKSTGEPLRFKGKNVDPLLMGTYDFIDALIYSEYITNGMSYQYQTTDKMPISINFTEGSYIEFYIIDRGFNDFQARINGIYEYFKAYTVPTQKYYSGQIYNIYLEPIDYYDGVTYINCGNDLTGWGAYCCINKNTYDIGETIRVEYKMPNPAWLLDNDFPTNNYQLKIYNKDDYFLGNRLSGLLIKTPYIIAYNQTDGDITIDGNRHTLEIPVTENINEYGFDNFYNDYEIVIEAEEHGLFQWWQLIDHVDFFVSGVDFQANGTITDITPNPCYFGQSVTFSWVSNSVGRLELNYPSGDTFFSIAYGYSEGTHTLTRAMTVIGTFSVELYSYGSETGNITLPVDTDTLIVNPMGENGSFGEYGFGVCYLYIPNYRVIAGYDTVHIYYRTYKNNSVLNITSPREEITYWSTTVSNQSDNTLDIEIKNYMQIGTWNVSLDGGNIDGEDVRLLTSFNIVNEEGNWIEFGKNVFTTDEAFTIYVKHSYRVALTFYKNGIAQGETIIYEIGENDNTKVVIPTTIIPISAGNWRVEMWRINDRNQVYELAEWDCIVVQGDTDLIIDDTTVFGFEIPPFVLLIIGVLIVLIMTISPMIILTLINKNSNANIELPALVYVAFFFFGVVVSVLLGLISIVVPFIVMFGLVLAFAVMWVRGKTAEG